MEFLTDESGQGAAEYILLFAAVIFFAVAAIFIYESYFVKNNYLHVSEDLNEVRVNLTQT
ncbi:MAG: class III signal peptide-containing protein [Methanobacteriales archaeon Met13]